MISQPEIWVSSGLLWERKEPSPVAVSPSRMKIEEKLATKISEGGTTLKKNWNPDERGALYDQMVAFVTKSLKSLKDVRAYTHFAVLGNIPLLENDMITRRRRRMAWIGWSTALLASVLIVGVSVYYYVTTKQ